jgi:protein-disulfide isomerase
VSKTSARERLARQQQDQQRRRDRRILALVAIGVVIVLVAGGIGFQAWRTSQQPSAGPSASASATPVQLTNGKPVVFGSADAPVTIALYEDFHCPHCAEFEEQYESVLTAAQERGQAKIEFYPLSFVDAGSVSAANGFACAAEAGFGQAYYSGLFANPTLQWNDSQLLTLAEQVIGSAPSDAFRSCVTDRRHLGWVQSITAAADAAGVTGTPTMFLNGARVDIASLTPDALADKIAAAAKS